MSVEPAVPAAATHPVGSDPLALRAGYLLRRSHRLHGQIWASIVPPPLTSPQFGVLSVVKRHPGIDQSTLGARTSLDRASIADIVGRLVDRGAIHRERDSSDSRRNLLTLDPGMERPVAGHRRLAVSVWDEMFAPVPASARESFVEQLETLVGFAPEEPDAGALFRRLEQKRTATWAELVGDVLTGAQYAVLHVVGQYPGLNQTELGEFAAVDRSTATQIVDRLVARGLVVRAADDRDARVRRLHPTAEALSVIAELAPKLTEVQQRLLHPLSESSAASLLANWGLLAYRGDPPEWAH